MYEIDSLEKKWEKYRRKKMLFPVILSTSALFVLIFAAYFLPNLINKDNIKHIEKKSVKIISQKNTPQVSKLNNLSIEVPSLKPDKKIKVGQIIFNDSTVAPVIHKKKNLLIQITERSKSAIPIDIERRFSYTKEKDDALFLARYYYDKRLYSKAEKWALETNKIDSNIEESWLIFAKAKAKRSQRIEALKILQTYYNETQSTKARTLIDSIRRGNDF